MKGLVSCLSTFFKFIEASYLSPMQKTLFFIKNTIDSLNEFVGKVVAWLTALLVLLVCYDVITRYLLNDTSVWVMELEWHLFALIFLLGAAYALKHNKHVRVDVFYANFSERDKAWVNLVGGLLFLLPWCLLIIYWTFDYALLSYGVREGSPDPGGLPARYFIKFAIPVGISLLLLQNVSSIIKNVFVLKNWKEFKA